MPKWLDEDVVDEPMTVRATIESQILREGRRGVADILDMMLHIADVNAQEVKERERTRPPERLAIVTAALLEKQEWAAFKAQIERRDKLLGVGDIDEDDADLLLSLIGVLERARDRDDGSKRVAVGLTISEIVREMQNDKVLAREFPAAARTQAQRLLGMLREMNRVWVDQHGRFVLGVSVVPKGR